jgi:hypothetical protein
MGGLVRWLVGFCLAIPVISQDDYPEAGTYSISSMKD